jgi:hypothetical protein
MADTGITNGAGEGKEKLPHIFIFMPGRSQVDDAGQAVLLCNQRRLDIATNRD